MKRIQVPPEKRPHSVGFTFTWTRGALAAIAGVILAVAGKDFWVNTWWKVAAFFGLMSLCVIVLTPLFEENSPEDVLLPLPMIGPGAVLLGDVPHRGGSLAATPGRSRLNLAGAVSAAPVLS